MTNSKLALSTIFASARACSQRKLGVDQDWKEAERKRQKMRASNYKKFGNQYSELKDSTIHADERKRTQRQKE